MQIHVDTKFERVQRQASKFIINDYVSPYREICTVLFILPLCFRREIIVFPYSYLHSKQSCDYSSNFELGCPHNGLKSADMVCCSVQDYSAPM